MIPRKRFKRDSTLLEWLPNELFVEMFSYLSDVDIVCAFSPLNQRFQRLILAYCYTFNFKSVGKVKFDHVIRQHDIHQWRSLCLSDDNNTPGQVTYFCQLFSFNKYISHLDALSIINMKPLTALAFLPQLTLFNQLVSLSLGSICGKTIPLLELSSLKHLTIISCMHSNWMKNLQPKSLQHTIEHHCTHEHNLTWPTTLKQLKVFLTRSGDNEIVRTSLSHLSELTSLTINDKAWENPPPDGQLWEKLIISSMPLLEKFKFCFKFWRDFSLISDINGILSTFSTPFYLKDMSCFTQCDFHHQQFSIAILYSLPFAFQSFEIVTHSFDKSISTSTNDLNKNLYKNVQTLTVDVTCEKMNEKLLSRNIVDLNLKCSGITMDWIYSMNELCHLSFGHEINISSKNFIRLLENTRRLHSLSISYHTLNSLTNEWKNQMICRLLSNKIRSLKISSDNYVKVYELLPIVRIFCKRCQYLNIPVYSRNIVVGLILRNMTHLRSLKVRLKEYGDDLKISKEWLIEQDVTFKNLDCFIVEDDNEYSFWFGRRRR